MRLAAIARVYTGGVPKVRNAICNVGNVKEGSFGIWSLIRKYQPEPSPTCTLYFVVHEPLPQLRKASGEPTLPAPIAFKYCWYLARHVQCQSAFRIV